MRKKLLIGVLVGAASIVLIACGKEEGGNTSNGSVNVSSEKIETNTQNDSTEKQTDNKKEELTDEYLLSLAETEAELFRYEEQDDGTIMIKGYKGDYTEDTIIVIPRQIDGKDVTCIKSNAFKNKLAKAIVTGANVSEIGADAFLSVDVKKLVINGPVKKIYTDAFMNSKIGEVSFGEKVEEIGLKSFTNCNIKSIKIPSTIKLIDQAAFAMSDLEEVYFEGGNVKVCDLAFGKCKNLKKVYVPDCGITFDGEVFSSSDDVTIFTPSGSTADEYAKAKGIKVKNN
jgi:hypothetical protein